MTLTPVCHMGLARPFWIPRVTQPVSQFLGCNGVGQSANYPPKFLRQPLRSMSFLSLSQWSRLPATTLPNSWDDLTHQSILCTMSITLKCEPTADGCPVVFVCLFSIFSSLSAHILLWLRQAISHNSFLLHAMHLSWLGKLWAKKTSQDILGMPWPSSQFFAPPGIATAPPDMTPFGQMLSKWQAFLPWSWTLGTPDILEYTTQHYSVVFAFLFHSQGL